MVSGAGHQNFWGRSRGLIWAVVALVAAPWWKLVITVAFSIPGKVCSACVGVAQDDFRSAECCARMLRM